jgi:hypothetical protein
MAGVSLPSGLEPTVWTSRTNPETSQWIMRAVSSYHTDSLGFFSAQYVLILCGPPIYSAAEYNVLGRLMHYLPMHASLHPGRVVYFFVYLGAAVEGLTAAGSARLSVAKDDKSLIRSGGTLVTISLVLQAVVELLFMCMVGWVHYRCAKSNMVTKKVRTLCIMLYGTSTLILLRCICRVIDNVTLFKLIDSDVCGSSCQNILRHEWFLYVFEAVPMVLYTFWLNIIHPGRFLPRNTNVYLDFEGVERVGPGWTDKRSAWMTFLDPFDFGGMILGNPSYEKYWLEPTKWPLAVENSDGENVPAERVKHTKAEVTQTS